MGVFPRLYKSGDMDKAVLKDRMFSDSEMKSSDNSIRSSAHDDRMNDDYSEFGKPLRIRFHSCLRKMRRFGIGTGQLSPEQDKRGASGVMGRISG